MKKLFKIIPLLFVMAMIFYFSSQPANDSTATSGGVVKIFYEIYDFVFNGKGISYELFCERYFQPIRKLAHFSEFGVLGVFSYINSKEYFNDRFVLISFIFCVVYAISDEIHQLFVPGRYCAFKDMLIDASGAFTAILFMHFISKRCSKK